MTPKHKAIYALFAITVFGVVGLTAAVLRDSTSLQPIAAFTTDLGPRSPQQRHNISRAASRIDGLVIKPGAEFSFNKAVGQCGVEQGYELAPAIIAGVVRPSWGGGVCQVSSTLYNAALLANLNITERHAHTQFVSSVPPGRDATTAFGVSDLRFVNTTRGQLRIKASTSGGRLTISLLGEPRAKANVEIVTENSRRMRDRRGKSQTVSAYRIIHLPSGSDKRELLSADTYHH
jgi:vancomycin resistance protein YoaR